MGNLKISDNSGHLVPSNARNPLGPIEFRLCKNFGKPSATCLNENIGDLLRRVFLFLNLSETLN